MSGFARVGQMIADLAASDECVEDVVDLPRSSRPPVAVLLGLLAEGVILVAMGVCLLVVR